MRRMAGGFIFPLKNPFPVILHADNCQSPRFCLVEPAIKFARKLVPWDRAFSQLNELALARLPREYPHPSGLVAAARV